MLADKSLSAEESGELVQHLSRKAVELGIFEIITQLGQAQELGDDPLEGVPEVKPVMTQKVYLNPFTSLLRNLN